ncbi:MAG TPA: glycosyltransferase family 4 protein [Candidatus Dormibacteraeota bacterium]|nr:glycosyltransferase family 4 protein [Candidatus Dormibacteraeota bacterium]
MAVPAWRAAVARARSRGWLYRSPFRKVGYLDGFPRGGELLGRGPHTVSGWVFQSFGAQEVVVSVDQRTVATASLDLSRPDAVEIMGLAVAEAPRGWAVDIELGDGAGPVVEISASLRLVNDQLLRIARTHVRVVEHPLRQAQGHIDAPLDGSTVPPGALVIAGWADFLDGLPMTVELRLNGGVPWRARTGVYRPDLAPGNMVGFEEVIDISGHAAGERLTIDAVATSLAGDDLPLGQVACLVGEATPVALAEAARATVLRSRTGDAATAPRASAPGGVRLAVFTHDLGYGGGQLYLHELLRRWACLDGFSARLVAPADGPLRPGLEEMGIEVHICGNYPVHQGVDGYEGQVRHLVDWARPQGFNLAMVNSMNAFLGADVATRLGIPVVWGIHESLELPVFWQLAYGGKVHPYVQERALSALRRADLVAFEADATRRQYEPHVAHAVTLPYGVALDDIDAYLATTDRAAARDALGLATHDFVILCMGTIEPRKSQALLAQAFERAARAHPGTSLVFVGDTGAPIARALREFVAQSRVADRVRVLPVASEIFPWYLSADLLVSASDLESLPRSVLEAMAFGVPVLAAAVSGLPEVIEDGNNGFLCEPRDVAALESALNRVLSLDPAGLAQVARAGAALVREQHDSARCAAEYWRRMVALAERG